jgi:molybdopterin-guanine dinucleotide biosynthesis protein A
LLETSAIILANENSEGFPKDKGTMLLDNKVLIRHVFDAINSLVDEVIIVTNSQERVDEYAKFLPKTVKFAIDTQQTQNPLNGAITGFETAKGKYTLLLPYDTPFINKELAKFLLELSIGKIAAVPRTPDNEIEPLCSVYQTKSVLETAKQIATEETTVDLYVLVEKLRGVRYISMAVIKQIDPELHSFFSINTPLDFKRATIMLQGKQKQQQTKHRK